MTHSTSPSIRWVLVWMWLPLLASVAALILLPGLWGPAATFAAFGTSLLILAVTTAPKHLRRWTFGYAVLCVSAAIGLAVLQVLA